MLALKKGSKGKLVEELQSALGIVIDGDFGPKTESAVKEYQKANGLDPDGIVGPKTWEDLVVYEPKYTRGQIKEAVLSKGYDWFEGGDYNLNIVGVRNSQTEGRVTNHYDDNITLSYDVSDIEKFYCWNNTTDPGEYWIDHPMNKDGTAILVPGQYKGVYKIDKHGGRYKALCQRGGKVKVYRDGNLDDVYDYKTDTIAEGYYGINIHRSSAYKTGTYINKYSAGCQVFSDPDDFDDFMEICHKSADLYGNKFTYTLIESKDIV